MSQATQRLIVGVVVGVLVTVGYYAWIEDTLPERLLEYSPIEVSLKTPEPPTQAEVKQRAEALESQSLLIGYGAIACVDIHGLVREAEAKLKRRYPDHHDVPLSDLYQISDTRIAWDILDDMEKLMKDISRACRR